ncbi:MAG: hypothetical protein Q8N00_13020 [Nitrospirota bacterium]|nr:hypothetical protein [Nitrospirota bacterium]MDP3596770.1 hypothetical protein [Nitrospirota bacterium]
MTPPYHGTPGLIEDTAVYKHVGNCCGETRKSKVKCLLLFASLLVTSTIFYAAPALADEVLEAAGLCHKIENLMNALVDYTNTKCLPTSDRGALNFILISEKSIFSVEASKKAWLIVTVGAVGKVMNTHQKIKSSDVFVSDLNMMKNRKSYKYPIALAKRLQRQAQADQIGIEELYKQLNRALVPYIVPQK